MDFSDFIAAPFPVIKSAEQKLMLLHYLTSEIFENYRHKNIENVKARIIEMVNTVIGIAEQEKIDLETECKKKINLNKTRTWDKDKLNEKIN
jgi:NTP pyrophosphatase (non-canonical NTP hydrolase)